MDLSTPIFNIPSVKEYYKANGMYTLHHYLTSHKSCYDDSTTGNNRIGINNKSKISIEYKLTKLLI